VSARRPNILLVTSDQHRSDCLGAAGHLCVRTPHLDRLAYAGIRFRNAYSNCPVCIPARTSLITGRDAHANGCTSYSDGFRVDRPRELFLGSLITRAGYETRLIGKTHWHTDVSFRAGFESVVGVEQFWRERLAATGRETLLTGIGANELSPTESLFAPGLNSTQWMIDRAIDFVDFRERGTPFFLWVSLIEPHPPNVIHEPYYSMYDDEAVPEPVMPAWTQGDREPYAKYVHRLMHNPAPMGAAELRKARGVYYGTVTHIDHQLGRLFGKLVGDGLWDDTLVVYTTDHGEHLGDGGDFAKSTFAECSAGLPFIVKPHAALGAAAGSVSDALVELSDLLPMFCEAAGAETPSDLTGRSLLPLMAGSAERVREELHGQIEGSHMLHDGHHKYLYFTEDGRQLIFDTAADSQDEHDLSADTGLLARMRRRLIEHLEAEGHEHLVDGTLVNRGLKKPPEAEVRARSLRAAGLGWAGRTAFRRERFT
jgi:arylsulfatase A-like enzyme